MQGRFHYYEGYTMQQITFPVRVMKELGVTNLLLSNAAGGMNPNYKKTDLVLIDDHINMLPENPLRGLNAPEFGNRFVDMCQPYNAQLNKLLMDTAAALNINLKKRRVRFCNGTKFGNEIRIQAPAICWCRYGWDEYRA